MTRQVQVEVLAGPNVGESFAYGDSVVLVGRGSQCTLQLLSAHVSREQCELRWYGDQLVLENKGRTNVTYVNDQPVDTVTIQDGDLITFCDVALRVRFPHLAAAAALDPNRTVAYQGGPPPGMAAQHPQSPPLGPEDTHPNPRAASPRPPTPAPPPQVPGARQPAARPHPQTGSRASHAPPRSPGGRRPERGLGTGSQAVVGGPGSPGGRGRPVGHGTGAHRGVGSARGGDGSGTKSAVGGGGGTRQRLAQVRNTGQQEAVKTDRRSGAKKAGAQGGLNIILIRNVLVALAAVMALLSLTSLIEDKTKKTAEKPGATADTKEAADDALPVIGLNGRSPEEVVASADGSYRTAMTFLKEAEVADGNLSKAIDGFRMSKAQLLLVEPQMWPSFARTLNPRIQEAEEKLHQKFSQSKISYVRFYQAGDYDLAMKETERMIRLIPGREDERHKYARKQQKRLRVLMSSKKKKRFGG